MKHRQRGFALLLGLLLAFVGGAATLLAVLNRQSSPYQRDRVTADALAQAKAALIGYAASAVLTPSGAPRPGDLPCPDMNDDGSSETACGNGAGSTGQSLRLGRLPWKDLGLPDLRDGSGERLWYAVSSNFKKNTRYSGTLNSDTPGTITVRDATGAVIFDGAAGSGVVAVVIAPGAPLVRPTSLADSTPYAQDRSGAGTSQPANYLDIANGEDNAGFTDGGADGFIAGPIFDSTGKLVANDRLLWIRADELAVHLEKRVAGEVVQCLAVYGQANGWRYPWPAAGSLGTANAVNYTDTANRRFGRVPDARFLASQASAPAMTDHWTGNCNIASASGWWLNWKEQVFYAVADNHKPASGQPADLCGVAGFSGASCLSLDGRADRQFIVLVAGLRQTVAGQQRGSNSQKNALANYLEGANSSDDDLFASTGGNDRVRGWP